MGDRDEKLIARVRAAWGEHTLDAPAGARFEARVHAATKKGAGWGWLWIPAGVAAALLVVMVVREPVPASIDLRPLVEAHGALEIKADDSPVWLTSDDPQAAIESVLPEEYQSLGAWIALAERSEP